MPTTPNGLRYPLLGGSNNPPQDIQALAEDADPFVGDTDWLLCTSVATGWTGAIYARQVGKEVKLRGTLVRTAEVEVTEYTYLFTLPPAIGRPVAPWVTNGQRAQECQNFKVDPGGGVLTITSPASACRWWVTDAISYFVD